MKSKLICSMFLVLALGLVAFGQEVVEIERVGLHPLFKGGFTDAEQMREAFKKSPAALREALEAAGHEDLVETFMQQFGEVPIELKEIPVEDMLPWMIYRKRGKVTLIQNGQWMGKKPLQVFAFAITKEGTRYHFAVPLKCGNLSLHKSEELPRLVCGLTVTPQKANLGDTITADMTATENASEINVSVVDEQGTEVKAETVSLDNPMFKTTFEAPGHYMFKTSVKGEDTWPLEDECEAKIYINAPPICDLKASADEIILGEKLVLDASGSRDKDGTLTKLEFEFLDEEENVVMTEVLTSEPYLMEPEFEKPGMYTINLVVTDDFKATSDTCTVRVKVRPRLLFFAEVAPSLAYGTYHYYTSIRGGLLYRIIPRTLDLKVAAGGGLVFSDQFKNFFMANANLQVNFDKFFIGAGLGYSTKYLDYLERETLDVLHGDPMEDGWDAIVTLGYDIIQDKGTIFTELRIPFGGNREFDNQHIILAGFTYYF